MHYISIIKFVWFTHVYGRWAISLNEDKNLVLFACFYFERYVLEFEYETLKDLSYSWDLINYKLVYLNIGGARVIICIAPSKVNVDVFMVDIVCTIRQRRRKKSDLFPVFFLFL